MYSITAFGHLTTKQGNSTNEDIILGLLDAFFSFLAQNVEYRDDGNNSLMIAVSQQPR
jgi:hypothetical protein